MPQKKFEITIEKISQAGSSWIGSSASLITHTIIFVGFFIAGLLGFDWSTLLLILTTIVSLEAIYLSIFIQMSVNKNTKSLEEVEEDIEEIQEDIDEIQEDVDEIQTDVDEIQEDVVEIVKEDQHVLLELETLDDIEKTLAKLQEDIIQLRKQKS